jgi:uncharacterized alpha-E superfamily protein
MLSRIANNLFWMARYIERVEYSARFTEVNYFAALDAHSSISSEFNISALLRMNGYSGTDITTEEDALIKIGFDPDNFNSILNCVTSVRENARSARDILSTELWETINRYYHFTISYDSEAFSKTNLFEFTQKIIEQTSLIKGRIDSTLIHNDTWLIINLGLYLERCSQVLRVVLTKLDDLALLQQRDKSPAIESHQIETMLRSLESFDMSRKYYRCAPSLNNSLEFLILNKKFPRSISSCLRKLKNTIDSLEVQNKFAPEDAGFLVGKLHSKLNYMVINDIMPQKREFILELQNDFAKISGKLIADYLS